MTIRTFCMLAAAIFALIALLQLIRIVMGWSVTLNGVDVPFWASWIAVTVAGALSFVGFRAAMRSYFLVQRSSLLGKQLEHKFEQLGYQLVAIAVNPVMLPSGRARLATGPLWTGSLPIIVKTTGIVMLEAGEIVADRME